MTEPRDESVCKTRIGTPKFEFAVPHDEQTEFLAQKEESKTEAVDLRSANASAIKPNLQSSRISSDFAASFLKPQVSYTERLQAIFNKERDIAAHLNDVLQERSMKNPYLITR